MDDDPNFMLKMSFDPIFEDGEISFVDVTYHLLMVFFPSQELAWEEEEYKCKEK